MSPLRAIVLMSGREPSVPALLRAPSGVIQRSPSSVLQSFALGTWLTQRRAGRTLEHATVVVAIINQSNKEFIMEAFISDLGSALTETKSIGVVGDGNHGTHN